MRTLQWADRLLAHVDRSVKTMTGTLPVANGFEHDSQADELTPEEQSKSRQLMRINHCGEVCAQGLYHGQMLSARNDSTKDHLQHAAEDEQKHLLWCQERLRELSGQTSYLNPLWYGASFVVGAATGLMGDRVSLGFIAATEEEVCKHLDRHLAELPEGDHRTREIIARMQADEAGHEQAALDEGGAPYPVALKKIMALQSALMTNSTRWI
ncbi:MAG: 2-polyprenyl-3-methyl-6-methoxy-1,4-benzoquinone monooxygenase [Gammaproteobacteria bacterium]|jgi:ubiquinone biosynthesis monooxygenase Coq7|nr:2-polyprenyl-3-methyl-6-methoxy-1,4-benzoquinone monooxygenase [Gammaproteobacteria bacterium]